MPITPSILRAIQAAGFVAGRRAGLISLAVAVCVMLGINTAARAQGPAAAATQSAATQRAALKLPPVQMFMVGEHKAFVLLPPGRNPAKAMPWVWYAPTLGGLGLINQEVMMRRFMEAGIAVAGIDVGESYGSPRGRALFTAFYEEMVRKRGMSAKPCMVGQSRGGLQVYNWAAEHPSLVSCIVGIYPVCDLTFFPGVAAASKAYEMSATQLTAEIADHNPISRLEPLAKAGVPILHIHGDADLRVPLEKNSKVLAERYRKLGGEIRLIVIAGQGHNAWPGWWDNAEMLDFIVGHLAAP